MTGGSVPDIDSLDPKPLPGCGSTHLRDGEMEVAVGLISPVPRVIDGALEGLAPAVLIGRECVLDGELNLGGGALG